MGSLQSYKEANSIPTLGIAEIIKSKIFEKDQINVAMGVLRTKSCRFRAVSINFLPTYYNIMHYVSIEYGERNESSQRPPFPQIKDEGKP